MRWKGVILALLLFAEARAGYEYVYRNAADSSYNCYLICLPEGDSARALIIRDYSSLPDMNRESPYHFHDRVIDSGFAVLYTTTSLVFPELFYSDEPVQLLDSIVAEVLARYPVKRNLLAGGISASGTRALRYGQYCEQGKSVFGHRLNGVFSVDSPLDITRFYRSAKAIQARGDGGPMLEEANLVIPVFEEQLGGTPDEAPQAYREASVYTWQDSLGGNAPYYNKMPLILFHEPDIDWWLVNRSCSYFDINSFDIGGFYLSQKLAGHSDIQLVTTSGKGFDRQGARKPHSWTIVDEDLLIAWLLEHCGE